MHSGNVPPLSDVTRQFSGDEAFSHATALYKRFVSTIIPSPSAQIVANMESNVFRPATELQFAGLSLIAGKELENSILYSVSLACFAVDHLLFGWNAAW